MKKHTYTIEQVKDLIIWAKEQKVQALSIGDVGVTFSPLAFIDESPSSQTFSQEVIEPNNPNAPQDDEDLFWSAKS